MALVYITGTTMKEYNINGVLLPKRSYRDEELARGRKPVCEIEEDEWRVLRKNTTITYLVQSGALIVSNVKPVIRTPANEEIQSALAAREKQLEEAQESLQVLRDSIKSLSAEKDAIRAEAIEEIKSLRGELDQKKGKKKHDSDAEAAGLPTEG